jgi:hypothetical protein
MDAKFHVQIPLGGGGGGGGGCVITRTPPTTGHNGCGWVDVCVFLFLNNISSLFVFIRGDHYSLYQY